MKSNAFVTICMKIERAIKIKDSAVLVATVFFSYMYVFDISKSPSNSKFDRF